jgi:hypothetical protein
VTAIAQSIQKNGFYGAVIVQKSTGHILAGNHRVQAAASIGITEVPVLYVDVDDDQAMRILLADNRTNDIAGYDDQALLDLLQAVPELEGTAFTGDDIDDLVHQLDQVPETPAEDFQGSFAENEEEYKSWSDPIENSTVMKEVVLLLPQAEHPDFVAVIKALEPLHGTSGVVGTVRAVVEDAYKTALAAEKIKPAKTRVTAAADAGE